MLPLGNLSWKLMFTAAQATLVLTDTVLQGLTIVSSWMLLKESINIPSTVRGWVKAGVQPQAPRRSTTQALNSGFDVAKFNSWQVVGWLLIAHYRLTSLSSWGIYHVSISGSCDSCAVNLCCSHFHIYILQLEKHKQIPLEIPKPCCLVSCKGWATTRIP